MDKWSGGQVGRWTAGQVPHLSRVDVGAHAVEEDDDEGRLVEAAPDEVLPELRVLLLLAEGHRLRRRRRRGRR